MGKLRLYVKSQKIDQVEFTMPHLSGGGHWCSAAYRSKGTLRPLTEEDNEAIEYLDAKGLRYSLLDLSDLPMKNRILSRVAGINQTPILVLDDGTKLRGMSEIKRNFEDKGDMQL